VREELREEGQTIALPDGRQLGYLSVGEGAPVFEFHGGGSSRLEALCLKEMAESHHLQIIGVDRPGFGLSSLAPKRRMRDFADDVTVLADHLGFDKFALVGFSAGGTYCIICAALLPERVTRAVVIGGPTLPIDTSGMAKEFQMIWSLATKPIVGKRIMKKFSKNMTKIFSKVLKDPDAFFKTKEGKNMLKSLSPDEAKVFTDPTYRPLLDILARDQAEAARQGNDGIEAGIQEMKLFKKGWDVDVSKIPSGVVYLWHGTADRNAPVSNAYRNAKVIPGAHLEIFEGGGHSIWVDNLEKLGEILSS
jgi:pimeloyl-ACP methyl ester carboxylesterase